MTNLIMAAEETVECFCSMFVFSLMNSHLYSDSSVDTQICTEWVRLKMYLYYQNFSTPKGRQQKKDYQVCLQEIH